MISILHFPGTNCKEDLKLAYDILGINSSYIWHQDTSLPKDTKLAIIAGGFSYGDYLRTGAIASKSNSIKALKKYAENGGVVLGICNGFQILCEASLLPGVLLRNASLNFISKKVELKVQSANNLMLKSYKKDSTITLPIAHADGNFYISKKELEKLEENEQILLKYTSNINGSVDNIAAICNKDKNIFALMPHPERAIFNDNPNLDSNNATGLDILKSLY